MKKKIYTRPISVVLTDEIFNRIKEITDQGKYRYLRLHQGGNSGKIGQ